MLAFAVGGGMGIAFFGGLWWTVRQGMASPRPWLWFGGSFLLRLGLIGLGFFYISGNGWMPLLAC
ncbi:ATP synthase subunit I, partial [Arthrospira platensis SPKY1]|nr:ATP synthase subunit I [Arthrospira platensis SPKY1]